MTWLDAIVKVCNLILLSLIVGFFFTWGVFAAFETYVKFSPRHHATIKVWESKE